MKEVSYVILSFGSLLIMINMLFVGTYAMQTVWLYPEQLTSGQVITIDPDTKVTCQLTPESIKIRQLKSEQNKLRSIK